MDHMPVLTSDAAMAAVLQRHLPGCREGTWDIEACRVVQTRCRISRRTAAFGAPYLGVCYHLAAREARSGRRATQWLYGKAYSQGMSEGAYLDAVPDHCVMPRLGAPVMHMPELDLVLWSLPNDPAMDRLPAFLDAAAVRPQLPLGRLYAAAADAVRVAAPQIVRHEPEEHCTARFALHHRGRSDVVFGKSYVGEAWRDARDCLDALWHQACADPRAFLVGRPLGASAPLRAVWQEEVSGRPLADTLTGPGADAVLKILAGALARLHADGPTAGRARPLGDILGDARKWRKKLIQADPRLAPALDAVLTRLEREAAEPRRRVRIHGDFHADQMMWCHGRIALFDYDNFALGAPARDLADFASQLLCREDRAAAWPAIAARLITHYRAGCAGEPDDAELDWNLRLMLLRKAYSAFVRSGTGWQARAGRALAAAQAGLAALAPSSTRGGA